MNTEIYETQSRSVSTVARGNPADEELLARIQAREEQALAALQQRHAALLRTVISNVVNNDQDVDDLVQEVFLEIWRQAAHYDQAKGKVLGWIVTLARRRAIDRLRKRQAYFRATERMRVELDHVPAKSDSVEDEVMASDTREILRRAVLRLPHAQQEAIRLAYYQGLSQREMAARTGIPLGTIKTRLELAVRKVRSAILALGGETAWRAQAGSRPHSRRHAVMPSRLSFE